MITMERLGMTLGIALILGVLPIGFYLFDEQSTLIEQATENVPLLKGTVEFMRETGKTVVSAGKTGSDAVSGFMFSALDADSWGRKKDQFYKEHPLLKNGIDTTGKAAETAGSVAAGTYGSTKDYLFPDAKVKAERDKAKEEVAKLNTLMASKQAEVEDLKDQISHINQKIKELERKADPLKKLVPDGVNFMGLLGNPSDKLNPPPLPPFPSSQSSSEEGSKIAQQLPISKECSCP